MTIDPQTAKDDLAFMRAIVEDHGSGNRSMGLNYLAAGILYGLQCLINGVLIIGEFQVSSLVWMAVGILPTILFLMVNSYTVWQNRAHPFGSGTTRRALEAAFAGGGLANLALALVFGWAAYQKQDWSIWLLFPIVVCAFQGAIWFTATVLRRQVWYGFTAAGWLLSPFLLSAFLDRPGLYVLILGGVLLFCMAVPGYIMARNTETS